MTCSSSGTGSFITTEPTKINVYDQNKRLMVSNVIPLNVYTCQRPSRDTGDYWPAEGYIVKTDLHIICGNGNLIIISDDFSHRLDEVCFEISGLVGHVTGETIDVYL